MKVLYAIFATAMFALASGSVAAQATQAQPGGGQQQPKGGGMFTALDRNYDDVLSRGEFGAAGLPDETFKRIDIDGDGAVTREEFEKYQNKGFSSQQ